MSLNIDAIKRRLLIKYPLFGSILANTKFIEDTSCYSNGMPTAGTDGNNIYYHPDAIKNISDDEQVFLFAHEICHIAFDHIFRSEGKDIEIWNIATDAVINAFLSKDGLPLDDGSVNIPEAINYDAETMYQKLLEDKKRNKNSQNGESNNDMVQENSQNPPGQKNNNDSKLQKQGAFSSENISKESKETENQDKSDTKDVGHDTHGMWSKAVERRKKQSEEKKENEQNNGEIKKQKEDKESDFNYPEREDNFNFLKQQEVKRLTELGEKEAFKQNKIERKKQFEELRQELASKSHGAGIGTDREQIKIDNIGTSSPLIDWRKLLKEAVKYEVDWSYKNASIEDGVVTPYLEELPMPETEILLDTSGSISETLLRNFLRECKNILQNSKVKVGCFDDEFYGYTEIRNENDIDNMEFRGGGGTDFNVAVSAFTRRVENKIIFTDGEASMPYKSMDVIWIVFGERKINPKGGKVIYINEEALRKLSSYYVDDDIKIKKIN